MWSICSALPWRTRRSLLLGKHASPHVHACFRKECSRRGRSWMSVAGLLARSIVVPGDLLRTCHVKAVPSRSATRWVHCNVSDCQFCPIQAGIHTPGGNADRDFRCWGRKCLINLCCGSGTNPSLPHQKISPRRYCLVHLLRWHHRHRSRLIFCVASLQTPITLVERCVC